MALVPSTVPSRDASKDVLQQQSGPLTRSVGSATSGGLGQGFGAPTPGGAGFGAPWPRMTPSDKQRYTRLFAEVDTDRDGRITEEHARDIFLSWRLPREVSKQVWDLSDQDGDSMLSMREFCTALYLMERFREGRPLPPALPPGIFADDKHTETYQPGAPTQQGRPTLPNNDLRYNTPSWQPNSGGLQPNNAGFPRPMPPAGTDGATTSQMPNHPGSVGDLPQGTQFKSKAPVLEPHLVNQLSRDEQDILKSRHKDAEEAEKKERVVKGRQRLFGPSGATSKAIKLFRGYYVLVQTHLVTHTERLFGLNGAATLKGLWLMMLLISWSLSSEAQSSPPAGASLCPLDFTILNPYPSVANAVKNSANKTLQCAEYESGLEAVIASYLKNSGNFLLPNGTSRACQNAYQSQLESQGVPSGFNISKACKPTPYFSERQTDLCHSIQSAQDFRSLVPQPQLNQLNSSCSGPLVPSSNCGICNEAISPVVVTLNGLSGSNLACTAFVNIYTIAVVNIPGPTDPNTLLCILYVDKNSPKRSSNLKFIGVGVGGMLFISIVGALIIYFKYWRHRKADREARKKRTKDLLSASSVPTSSINWFDIDELKRATGNFSRNSIVGTGGYGNVYKGTMPDGSLVALKRFKNCSPAGDKDFVHEVEMISSVKHRHLVEIRGCCVDSSSVNGHQRIIVYDYMSNGSLADHLFLKDGRPSEGGIVLSWATRKKIAIGMAKGLAYLHHDAVPTIFHRDIKASNILLDEDWNARLADFGLAKFTPEGVSHVTTRVAGTYGYVAPEYALYGQLTEKSDVYSFGMVVLELVSGRKALAANDADPTNTLLSDWAWPLVKQRRWRAIVDPRLGDAIGSDEEMEGFILVGLLCAHPQVAYRPSIDQALKMLERGPFGLSVPDRPLPFTSGRAEILEALSRESQENQDRARRTGYSSLSSLSYQSSDYSGSLPSSWYERKVSDKTRDDINFESSDASASHPSSYERRLSTDRTEENSIPSPEASLSSLKEKMVSPDKVQNWSLDVPASQLSTLDEDEVSLDRTQDGDLEKRVSPEKTRDGDVEKQVSPSRTREDIPEFLSNKDT